MNNRRKNHRRDAGATLVAASQQSTANNQQLDLVAGNLIEAPSAPGIITIMPWGEFSVHGNMHRLTEESIPLITERIAAHGVDLPIDYEHGTSVNPPADGQAIAAGWVKSIEAVPGAPLKARVEWTPAAARRVAAREYRYLSPTFFARKSDGVVVGLHSVALTNKPAIAGMPPIAAHTKPADAAGERTSAMKNIATCLGLAAEATEEQVLAKCKELLVSASDAKGLREAVIVFASELGDTALVAQVKDGTVEVVSASLKTAAIKAKNPAGMVAASDYQKLADEVKAMKIERATEACTALIAAHSTKLPPAKHEWFRKFYQQDAAAAKEWVEQAPELVAASKTAGGGTGGTGGGSTRASLIAAHRSTWAANKSDLAQICSSERTFISGELIAAGQAGISDEEAKSLALVG